MTREKTETTTKGKQVERNEPHQADTASSPHPPPHHPNCYCYCYRYREDDNKLLKPGDYRSLIASKNSTIEHKLIRAILSHIHTKRTRKARGRWRIRRKHLAACRRQERTERKCFSHLYTKEEAKEEEETPPPPTTFLILRHNDHHLPPNFRRLRLTTASSERTTH